MAFNMFKQQFSHRLNVYLAMTPTPVKNTFFGNWKSIFGGKDEDWAHTQLVVKFHREGFHGSPKVDSTSTDTQNRVTGNFSASSQSVINT